MKKLIYSIVSEDSNQEKLNCILPEMKGIAGAKLISVSYKQISAVVSELEKSDYIVDQSNALEYAGVIEKLADQFTLLPMRYGSLLDSTESIMQLLERNYPEFRQNLLKVEHKCEFGLKIFGDLQKLKAELTFEFEPVIANSTIPSTEIKNPVYLEYLNKKLKEHRFEESLLAYIDSVIAELTVCLTRFNAVSKFRKMTTAALVTDAVFLLDESKKAQLIQAI